MTEPMRVRKPKNPPPDYVEEQLETEETKTEEETEIPERKPSALPQPDPLPDYDSKFKVVHEYIVNCNPDEEWPVIREWMSRKPNSIQDAINMLAEHPDIKTRARRLALLAERELKKFNMDFTDRTGILRDLAREYWEGRKIRGYHKQITNDMIEDWIIEHYGTVYTEMTIRLKDMKNVAELLSKLADNADIRDADLRRMIDKIQAKDATAPGWFSNQNKVQERKVRR